MTKFISAIMNLTKITRVVVYIYDGLWVVNTTISAALEEIIKINPEFKYKEQLVLVLTYLKRAVDGVALIKKWLGVKADQSDVNTAGFRALSDVDRLKDINEKLDRELCKYSTAYPYEF